jgi:hypothetical protein
MDPNCRGKRLIDLGVEIRGLLLWALSVDGLTLSDQWANIIALKPWIS